MLKGCQMISDSVACGAALMTLNDGRPQPVVRLVVGEEDSKTGSKDWPQKKAKSLASTKKLLAKSLQAQRSRSLWAKLKNCCHA